MVQLVFERYRRYTFIMLESIRYAAGEMNKTDFFLSFIYIYIYREKYLSCERRITFSIDRNDQ